jgi:hypothetical protein
MFDGPDLDSSGIQPLRFALPDEWRKPAMRIVVANLPDDVAEEKIREALSPFAPVEKIKLARESGTPSAVIEMEMTRPQAEALAKRITGPMYQGQPLRAWVPAMGWE